MTANPYADGRAGIDAGLVRGLIADQFPQWAGLPVRPVEADGWDNRTYRLGDRMTVRLPTGPAYALAVEKEHRWLPRLAPALPVPVPVSLGLGEPARGYGFPWAVRVWLDGETARPDRIASMERFAGQVAGFLLALQKADPDGGPEPGLHNWYRGGPPAHWAEETEDALALFGDPSGPRAADPVFAVDTALAAEVWQAALDAPFTGPPVWIHGDIAAGNLLVAEGELAAVIDFGTCGVGDPACDLVIAWTMFSGASREVFRTAVDADAPTWARARGWALWKALKCLAVEARQGAAGDPDADPQEAAEHRAVADAVLADHREHAAGG